MIAPLYLIKERFIVVKYDSKLYDSIFRRSSIRSFQKAAIAQLDFAQVLKIAQNVSDMDDSVRVQVVEKCPEGLFKGIIGSYGRIKDPASYAVFIGNKNDPRIKEKIGYYGELFILMTVAAGLGTCWVSGTFESDMVFKDINLSGDEQIFAVTPLGYPSENAGLEHKLIKLVLRVNQRKPIKEICSINTFNENQKWIKTAVEAVRVAPSTRNIQPWYFEISGSKILLKPNIKPAARYKNDLIDFGIAMLHFELGASSQGVEGNWTYPTEAAIAEFK